MLGQAMAVCGPSSLERGEALVLAGELRIAEGRHEAAEELFNQSLLDVPAAPSNLPALLHRGMIRSMLGDQSGATTDFAEVIRRVLEQSSVGPQSIQYTRHTSFVVLSHSPPSFAYRHAPHDRALLSYSDQNPRC